MQGLRSTYFVPFPHGNPEIFSSGMNMLRQQAHSNRKVVNCFLKVENNEVCNFQIRCHRDLSYQVGPYLPLMYRLVTEVAAEL